MPGRIDRDDRLRRVLPVHEIDLARRGAARARGIGTSAGAPPLQDPKAFSASGRRFRQGHVADEDERRPARLEARRVERREILRA